MWRTVTDEVGIAGRDSLWDYPDLMPSAEDIDDPSALVARLQAAARGEQPVADEFDEALARLLDGDDFSGGDDEPTTGEGDSATAGEGDDGDTHPGDDRPEGERPV